MRVGLLHSLLFKVLIFVYFIYPSISIHSYQPLNPWLSLMLSSIVTIYLSIFYTNLFQSCLLKFTFINCSHLIINVINYLPINLSIIYLISFVFLDQFTLFGWFIWLPWSIDSLDLLSILIPKFHLSFIFFDSISILVYWSISPWFQIEFVDMKKLFSWKLVLLIPLFAVNLFISFSELMLVSLQNSTLKIETILLETTIGLIWIKFVEINYWNLFRNKFVESLSKINLCLSKLIHQLRVAACG